MHIYELKKHIIGENLIEQLDTCWLTGTNHLIVMTLYLWPFFVFETTIIYSSANNFTIVSAPYTTNDNDSNFDMPSEPYDSQEALLLISSFLRCLVIDLCVSYWTFAYP